MDLILVGLCLAAVIYYYFKHNPMNHSSRFMFRRFVNWFPLGMTYAFLYMGRYNLSVAKNALGSAMSKEDFGMIFGAGTLTYGLSFLINGPLVDKFGGRKGILMASIGSSLANIAMGVVTYLFLTHRLQTNLLTTFAILYSINMYFQSFGGVSIIKVKAYWFHVRERGVFGAIFGTLISIGVYFAYDWGQAIVDAAKVNIANPTLFQRMFRGLFATNTGTTDATWLVFFIPAFILIFWTLIDMWLIKDTPAEANFEDFDTHDASSGEMDKTFTAGELLKRVFTSPIMLTIAAVEFTGGVIRNGIMQWYYIFAKEVPQPGAEIFSGGNWGKWMMVSGILGGFAAGYVSDKYYQSRRGPPVALCNGVILASVIVMAIALMTSPVAVGTCAVVICFAVIGVHSLMSGTAAADFGGRKATATASGISDGFVYLGSGIQSFALGFLTTRSWSLWPVFLIPFTVIGLYLSIRMWKDLPAATRRYLLNVEKVDVTTTLSGVKRIHTEVLQAEIETVQVMD